MNKQELIHKIKNTVSLNFYLIIPTASGGLALAFLNKLFSHEIAGNKLYIGTIVYAIIFVVSAILFYKLKKLEKEKDQYLLSTVGKIVEDVFKHYGSTMANNAAGPVVADKMDPTMQTIVSLVKELNILAKKGYTENHEHNN